MEVARGNSTLPTHLMKKINVNISKSKMDKPK